ncbi:hypothetical protein HaLaN_21350 [Haematococcus lacustris]|uniref:Uncharacterized protein n=1 Tax=Haematococcus lacustris TaxID=44745 RepID=A0A699ZY66_HAELA|nr:hypothetical protein HaLaN_21350 [Haematococcus lacustris]
MCFEWPANARTACSNQSHQAYKKTAPALHWAVRFTFDCCDHGLARGGTSAWNKHNITQPQSWARTGLQLTDAALGRGVGGVHVNFAHCLCGNTWAASAFSAREPYPRKAARLAGAAAAGAAAAGAAVAVGVGAAAAGAAVAAAAAAAAAGAAAAAAAASGA